MTVSSSSTALPVNSPPYSRSTSRDSRTTYFPTQPEGLVVPNGAVSGTAAELLEDLSNEHGNDSSGSNGHVEHSDMDAGYHERMEHAQGLPWWKRPSPWWILGIMPFSAIAMSATLAPKIEIYTLLACSVHKPDIFRQTLPTLGGMIGVIKPIGGNVQPIISPITNNTFSTLAHAVEGTMGSQTCASDPTVQAAVAQLSAVITATMGVLSCITTGYWGSFSDRYGRTKIMGLSIIGLLFNDLVLIFTTLNVTRVPGGYWFLVLGPVVEGMLGGFTTATAACHAYISDTTTEAARSRTLSLSLGLMFSGMAFGPTIGSLLVHLTSKALAPFYLALGCHFIFAFCVWTIFPETLLPHQMAECKKAYDDDKTEFEARVARMGTLARVGKRVGRVMSFLTPLSVFVADVVREEEVVGDGGNRRNPLKKCGRDWNLLLLAMAYGLAIMIMGSYPYMFQYAAATFHWSTEQIGYWLSIVGFARGVFLTLILPIAIKLLKPAPYIVELPARPSQPNPNASDEEQPLLSRQTRTIKKEIHSPSFDMSLARISLFIEVLSYTLMAFAISALWFTISSIFGAFGVGFSPALQSVALALYMRKGGSETGKLFGALSVVQALSAQILGPAIYGLVYMKTVATYPRTIFYVSMISVVLSFICLSLVRVPKVDPSTTNVGGRREGSDEEEGVTGA